MKKVSGRVELINSSNCASVGCVGFIGNVWFKSPKKSYSFQLLKGVRPEKLAGDGSCSGSILISFEKCSIGESSAGATVAGLKLSECVVPVGEVKLVPPCVSGSALVSLVVDLLCFICFE